MNFPQGPVLLIHLRTLQKGFKKSHCLAKRSIKNPASTYPSKELHEGVVLSHNHLTQYLLHSFQQASDEMARLHCNCYVSFPVFHSVKDRVSIKRMETYETQVCGENPRNDPYAPLLFKSTFKI